MSHKKIIVVLGPTASGKSEMAVKLAKEFDGEVVSADSRQVYRGMDIGTGKTLRDNIMGLRHPYIHQGVRHHLLDVASPKRTFTVARYQRLARKAVRDILRRERVPIICGGTGFYIDALLYGYDLPHVPPQLALRKSLGRERADVLFSRLKKLDPDRAATIDRHNKRRLIRALEIIMTTGAPVSSITVSDTPLLYDALKIGIAVPQDALQKKIKKRLLARFDEGMIEEVTRLHVDGVSWKRLESFGLEYRQIARYLQNQISRQEMIDALFREICKYAKRQMTWFKRDENIHWVDNYREAARLVQEFLL
jgi:tRNA dimethylallyltransferase